MRGPAGPRGGRLGHLVELAGVPLGEVAEITIRGASGVYVVEPAWLRATTDDLRIGKNRRGLLRFGHERARQPVHRVSGVTAIEIRRR